MSVLKLYHIPVPTSIFHAFAKSMQLFTWPVPGSENDL